MSFGLRLRNAIERIKNSAFLDKETVKEAIKEIQRALIASDVEVSLVLELSKKIEKEAFKEPPKGVNRKEFVLKKTYDLLVEILGGEKAVIPENPKRILLVGLFGSGKTTSTIKIAKYYAKRGKKVGVIEADTFRLAAFDQLKQLAEKNGINFFGIQGEKNSSKIVEKGLKELSDCSVIIVDSAGRSALDEELISELKDLTKTLKPDNVWLVLSADIGQVAKKQAIAFSKAVNINGVVITKMDGSAKGGGALAACAATKSPVLFIGVGEKVNDLEEFDAERFLSRVMGYGDLQGLLEKMKEITEEKILSPEELLKGEFNLHTFYAQLMAARKMGPLKKVAEMLGLSMQVPKEQLELGEEKLESFKVIMDSMTKQEMRDPEILNKSRIKRIALGSGKKEEEVRELLKHFKQMKKVFKKFKKIGEMKELDEKKLNKLMQKFAKKKKFKIR
jgi:signal recognition particle subunit SRP54